ncbi:hypothetical protein CEP52_017457 [Fusarium oligoseptatum]|uniref:Uncharacterized protein n=1 Tax=Fusarium oligoseptatum TaxID=2604345 RepID=A0A428RR34_9HYPO|nr:hypothetical protein CEP52_017457 [Fusarium oligoseptatum]
MARDPSRHDDAMPRNLPEVQHAAISRHVAHLRATGQLPAEAHLDVEGNRHAVRIAAAASTETAWEYRSQSGQWVGLMTQALSQALRDAWGNSNGRSEPVSWRTTLLRVRELVKIDFPQQNPHVEGSDTRLLFSLEEAMTGALVLQPAEEGVGVIQGGRVSGVREDNVYALMPFGAERPSDKGQIGTATVTRVIGFKARAELSLFPGKGPIPREGVLAFLVQEALYKWPVGCPEGLDVLRAAVDKSKYLRHGDAEQGSTSLVEFRQDGQSLILSTGQGVQLASQQASDEDPSSWENVSNDLVKQAEQLAKAQHLQALTCDGLDEKLEHHLAVTFGTVKCGKAHRIIEQDGSGSVAEDELVYISLKNNGAGTVYASVFDINVAGKISLISKGSPRGIELPRSRPYDLGADQFGLGLQGLSVNWPRGVPRVQPVNEHLVLILTDSPVDLRYLADAATADSRGHVGPSSLERLAFRLATGAQRDMTSDSRSVHLRYDTMHIPFTVKPLIVEDLSVSLVPLLALDEGQEPRELRAEELLLPEEAVHGQDLPPRSPYLEQVTRGAIGAIIRAAKGIQPFVWVVNEHDEDILVVVSKYRPNMVLSGGGMTVSTTGVGIDFSSTSFLSPACQKPLAARAEGKDDATGVFPLWTRKEGFGVISIFKGPQKKLCIENDRIPLGATAFFSNKPNLRIVNYEGNEVSS